jgi:hypothetical protein
VTITGEGRAISGGALIGCAARQNSSPLTYGYLFQGRVYPVSGTPETTWSVTVDGATYSFSAADEGKTWTAETMEVSVQSITINGAQSGHSPGYLIYWPVTVDANGYTAPPTSGSTGVYYDVMQDFHAVEFRTTWSVPEFQTVFIWNSTDPFAGPYMTPTPHAPTVGDGDTWTGGDPAPGDPPGASGTE